jgi:tricorn protease
MGLMAALLSVASVASAASVAQASDAGTELLKRYPSVNAGRMAFVARGALWLTSVDGGAAQRVFGDDGAVIGPRFSPDGRWIAFTYRRAGRQDVYVVSPDGGAPRRLTFEATGRASEAIVLDWTPDSRRIVYLSSRGAVTSRIRRAFSVPVTGGPSEALPMEESGPLTFSRSGQSIIFNRLYRNDQVRKRYVGGQAQNLYLYDLEKRNLSRLTQWKGTDTSPMWYGEKVYFLSDRGGKFRANLWSLDLKTKAVKAITHFETFDIDSPSLGDRAISFQQGGKLYALDLPSERLREVVVDVPDDPARSAPREVSVGHRARDTDVGGQPDYALSPDGRHVLLSARGDLFRVSRDGESLNLTATPGAAEAHPSWSPDGRFIAYQTDSNGEEQIAIRPSSGGAERIVTRFKQGVLYTPIWSPDGQSLVVPTAGHELWLVPVAGGAARRIAFDPAEDIRDARFSPDGAWLAYSRVRLPHQRAIHLMSLATGVDTVVSAPMESDANPVFSDDGSALYFISRRNELPFVSDRGDEAIVSTLKSEGVFMAPLQAPRQAPRPGGAQGADASTSDASTSDAQASSGAAPAVRIDLPGLMDRAIRMPVAPAQISSLEIRGNRLFYETHPPSLIDGEWPGEAAALHRLDLSTNLDTALAQGLDNHSLSADGDTVLYREGGAWRFASTADTGVPVQALDLRNLKMTVDPRQEWRQMFNHAWRLDRDLFFNARMNGTDWDQVHRAYATLVPLLGSQEDFLYLLAQMQGEIATSHAFIVPGRSDDVPSLPRTPLLGMDVVADARSNRYQVQRVYRGDATRDRFRAPLGAPGFGVEEGDQLLAIDGRELSTDRDFLAALVGVGRTVQLRIASAQTGQTRELTVTPIGDEGELRQMAWVRRNRERVEAASGGTIGYLFLTDFNALGSEDFLRQYPTQSRKAGLIIDTRWNRGGFTSQAVLNVLRRAAAGVFVNRQGAAEALPALIAPPAMATLINSSTVSDGDQFAYYFRRYGLGPLVGTRTSGGVQGIKGLQRLSDGTGITIPKDSLAELNGGWIIENEGVAPDIEVDLAPDDFEQGRDRQLDRAIAVVKERMKKTPPVTYRAPALVPAYPKRGNVPGASFSAPR